MACGGAADRRRRAAVHALEARLPRDAAARFPGRRSARGGPVDGFLRRADAGPFRYRHVTLADGPRHRAAVRRTRRTTSMAGEQPRRSAARRSRRVANAPRRVRPRV